MKTIAFTFANVEGPARCERGPISQGQPRLSAHVDSNRAALAMAKVWTTAKSRPYRPPLIPAHGVSP